MKGVRDTLLAQKKMPGVSWEQLERQPRGIARGIHGENLNLVEL